MPYLSTVEMSSLSINCYKNVPFTVHLISQSYSDLWQQIFQQYVRFTSRWLISSSAATRCNFAGRDITLPMLSFMVSSHAERSSEVRLTRARCWLMLLSLVISEDTASMHDCSSVWTWIDLVENAEPLDDGSKSTSVVLPWHCHAASAIWRRCCCNFSSMLWTLTTFIHTLFTSTTVLSIRQH